MKMLTEFAKNKLKIRGLPTELLMAVKAVEKHFGKEYAKKIKKVTMNTEIYLEFNCNKKLSDEVQSILFPLSLT